jgi:hypothetical protein
VPFSATAARIRDYARRRRVGEGFVSILREMPGFVAYYWVDTGDGVMFSTSLFEDEEATAGIYEEQEGVEESNRRAAEWVEENLAQLLPKRNVDNRPILGCLVTCAD